jgi:hypothetical protein
MKQVSTGLAFAFAISYAVVSAQGGTTTGSATAQAGRAGQAGQGDPVTVTGCLQRSDTTGTAGPTGATGVGSPDRSTTAGGSAFILTNASMNNGAAGAASTGASSTGAGASAATGGGRGAGMGMGMARTYVLLERNTGELAPHVGHRMEVTGTLAAMAMPAMPAGSSTPPSDSGAGRMGRMGRGGMPNQRLQVSSIRMISAACDTGTPSSGR